MQKILLIILCWIALTYTGCQNQTTAESTKVEAQEEAEKDDEPTLAELFERAPKVPKDGIDSLSLYLERCQVVSPVFKLNLSDVYAGNDTAIYFGCVGNRSTYSVEIDTITYKIPKSHMIGANGIPPQVASAFWGEFRFDKPLGHLTDTITVRFKRVKRPITLIIDLNVVEKEK